MSWIGNIFSFVWDISDFFRNAYNEVKGWIWPFYYLQYPLYGLYRVFWSMLDPIAQFWFWAEDVWAKVQSIWTSDGILGLIKWWFPWLYDVGEWFYGRWNWFLSSVGDWWNSTKTTVLGWIDIAKEWALELIEDTNRRLTELQPVWDFFKGKLENVENVLNWYFEWKDRVIAAVIRWGFVTALDVAGLIAAAFLEREDLWAGWQDFRDKIADFFTDPLEFLWTLFADWFLGPEE